MKTAVLIPVYNPDIKFPALVRELKSKGYVVVVCNDGSDPKYDSVFDQVKDDVCYVSYEKNKGKGYALKHGLQYIKDNYNDCIVVTLDSDGQHKVMDAVKICDECEKHEEKWRPQAHGARIPQGRNLLCHVRQVQQSI